MYICCPPFVPGHQTYILLQQTFGEKHGYETEYCFNIKNSDIITKMYKVPYKCCQISVIVELTDRLTDRLTLLWNI